MSKTMVIIPRISEKAYTLSQLRNTYIFDVPTTANRTEVAAAVTAQFEVEVTEVNILNVKGKPKRTVRKGGRPINGKRADTKKAYVTLKAGDSLPVFAALDEPAAEPKPDQQKKGKK
jgi:large subunit ribosomal protein L23